MTKFKMLDFTDKTPVWLRNSIIWFVNNRINIIFLVVFATTFSMAFTCMVGGITGEDSAIIGLVVINLVLTSLIGILVALHQMGYPIKQEYES